MLIFSLQTDMLSADSCSAILQNFGLPYLAQLIWPRIWRRNVSLKLWLTFNRLHDVIPQKMVLFISTVVGITNPTCQFFVMTPLTADTDTCWSSNTCILKWQCPVHNPLSCLNLFLFTPNTSQVILADDFWRKLLACTARVPDVSCLSSLC
jgi:hypothetical protein